MFKVIKKIPLVIQIFIFLFLACSNEQIKKDKSQNVLEFRDEGFISENKYRIIIVKPKYRNTSENGNTEEYAKKRALISLRKYIQSRQGKVSRNANAAILNLIDQYGKLRQENSREGRDVFLFEIEKASLREYLDKL